MVKGVTVLKYPLPVVNASVYVTKNEIVSRISMPDWRSEPICLLGAKRGTMMEKLVYLILVQVWLYVSSYIPFFQKFLFTSENHYSRSYLQTIWLDSFTKSLDGIITAKTDRKVTVAWLKSRAPFQHAIIGECEQLETELAKNQSNSDRRKKILGVAVWLLISLKWQNSCSPWEMKSLWMWKAENRWVQSCQRGRAGFIHYG